MGLCSWLKPVYNILPPTHGNAQTLPGFPDESSDQHNCSYNTVPPGIPGSPARQWFIRQQVIDRLVDRGTVQTIV